MSSGSSLLLFLGGAGAGFGQDFGIIYESADITPDGTQPVIPADQVNDYIPQGRPGHRAPHLWVQRDGQRVSLLDFFGNGFTLLCGPEADPASFPHPARHARVVRECIDFQDPDNKWRSIYGVSRGGFVLVRPDGYVCARVA